MIIMRTLFPFQSYFPPFFFTLSCRKLEAEGAVDAAWKKEAVALREIGNWHYALRVAGIGDVSLDFGDVNLLKCVGNVGNAGWEITQHRDSSYIYTDVCTTSIHINYIYLSMI